MPDAAYAAAQALVSWLVVAVFASQIAALTYPAFRSVAARGNPSSRALAQFSTARWRRWQLRSASCSSCIPIGLRYWCRSIAMVRSAIHIDRK